MLKARLNEVDFPLPLFAGELLVRYRVEIRVQAFSNVSFIVEELSTRVKSLWDSD